LVINSTITHPLLDLIQLLHLVILIRHLFLLIITIIQFLVLILKKLFHYFQQVIQFILLKVKVKFVPDCKSSTIPKLLEKLEHKQILLLENTRFYAEEETNDKTFAEQLAAPFDLYVNDAFGTAHRAHASTEGVTHFLKSYSGLLMESEIKAMAPLLDSKKLKKPLTVIVGGAKIDTKIGVIKQFIGLADYILVGGALANTFLLAEGFNTGKSLVEKDKIDVAQEILLLAEKKKTKILIPGDVIVADKIEEKAATIDIPVEDVIGKMMILDIGRLTAREYSSVVHKSKTVILNGPMGLYEMEPFASGTKYLFKEIAKSKATTVIGGGDTIDAINKFKISPKKFNHVSTGGGAMIEFLEGRTLPGIVPLVK
jgi:3-phosphoglycerate kinase